MNRALAHARWETRLLLRNGEQVLLTLVIPVGLLLGFSLLNIWPVQTDRLASAVAAVWTVSVLASCFTSLAIATGFERRSGALRFLSTTPLTRLELLAGKVISTTLVTVLSMILVGVVAMGLGWRPTAWVLVAVLVCILAGAALGSWAFVLAGTLRAEAVLAVANALFLILLLVGGIIVPLDRLPQGLADLAQYLPTGALSQSLDSLLVDASMPGARPLIVLTIWLVAGIALARRAFRWS